MDSLATFFGDDGTKATILLRISGKEAQAIRQAAKADDRSINSWCKLALLSKIKGTTPITANLSQGEAVIIQKRGKHGLFEPTNKKDGGLK